LIHLTEAGSSKKAAAAKTHRGEVKQIYLFFFVLLKIFRNNFFFCAIQVWSGSLDNTIGVWSCSDRYLGLSSTPETKKVQTRNNNKSDNNNNNRNTQKGGCSRHIVARVVGRRRRGRRRQTSSLGRGAADTRRPVSAVLERREEER
jgi:hypothetical protein